MSEPIELLTIAQGAKRLTVSKSSFYRLIESGRIRVVHPTPGTTRVTSRELDSYIASLDRRKVA